ncbi:MAG TPA: diaminopimelate decarboxylase [Bacteroidales bacterium]|nr:diaminopimelate decarboxylase [Bacteroidales bacterium]
MIDKKTTDKLLSLPTPFYFYDMAILNETLRLVKTEAEEKGFSVHYAVKANFNPVIMRTVAATGLGADCVSGNEIEHAISCGFRAGDVVFAGVGKSDSEIETALRAGIKCFNCESMPELRVIDEIAGKIGVRAPVALRINPNIEAHTIRNITTGTDENKFGIRIQELDAVASLLGQLKNIDFRGIHFHIGSQVTDTEPFRNLCTRVNQIYEWFCDRGLEPENINLGGGLGISYDDPDRLPPFREYFGVFKEHLNKKIRSTLSFELGRSLTAPCGSLISRVLYVKEGAAETFVILDAGMTDLMRPALYHAYHRIENLTSRLPVKKYTVAGPICETTDTFGKFVELPETSRGDLIAIRSAGAYGESMASRYNLRSLPGSVFSDKI